uniref:Uncharacterized protein n=1 Tax=Romanomermis culicivorax TaxID=13658 RepID=A0A915KWC8_ROMCU
MTAFTDLSACFFQNFHQLSTLYLLKHLIILDVVMSKFPAVHEHKIKNQITGNKWNKQHYVEAMRAQ